MHQQSTLFILIKSTDNEIGERGTTSLSEALKSNTTLTKLDLDSEYKTNGTQTTSIRNSLYHSHQIVREQGWRQRGIIIE